MNVVDIMTASPVTIRLERTLREALELMEKHSFKHLPVMSAGGHLVGVISDRDCRHALNSPFIMRAKWQDEALINTLQVRAVMTAAPIIIEPNAPAAEAARLMLTHRIGCLPVMRSETLIGIVTRSDILVAFMNMQRRYEAIAAHRHGTAEMAAVAEPKLHQK
ncbi:MAG: CBS domain-containing protein [Anaerolineae bacterium]|jgi:acetoin utilization protein AcuB|nr:CBS domain-containing protein [Anaerolineae bacterium]